jgi:hypothetical protein
VNPFTQGGHQAQLLFLSIKVSSQLSILRLLKANVTDHADDQNA